nr:MAG TPA: hypothetical protein [Caudoviricetes sp.]
MNRQQYGLGVSLTEKVKGFMGLPRSPNVVMRKVPGGYQGGTMPDGYNDPAHQLRKGKRAQLENVQFFREESDARSYADRLLEGGL